MSTHEPPHGRLAFPVAIAFAITLAGCAAPPTTRSAAGQPPDLPLPPAWSAPAPQPGAGAALALAQWWLAFDDDQLSALVMRSLQANGELLSAQAALRQARALRDVAAAGLQPAAVGSASAQRSKSGQAPASNLFKAGFDASWEPDVFGGTASAVAAADADAQASATTLGDVQVSIAAEAAAAYIALRGQQVRLAIARDNLASQQETLQIARWRTQAGLATSLEVEQARAAVEQTRAQIASLETGVAQSRSSLAVLTGQMPGTLALSPGSGPKVPSAAGDFALSLPADTLRQRPDVRSAEHRLRAAAARVSQAEAARLPSFRLGGSIGLSALTLGSLTGSGALATALLGSVSLPVYDGGAAQAQVRAQQAALEQAQLAWRAAVLAALKEVEDALAGMGGARERVATLRNAAEAAGNASLLARQRYASGLIDFQIVLETQRTLLSTQDSVAAAEVDLATAQVRLVKALGGGWPSEPATSSNPSASTHPSMASPAAAS